MPTALADHTAANQLPSGATGPDTTGLDYSTLNKNPDKQGMYRFIDTRNLKDDASREDLLKAPVIYVPYNRALELLGNPQAQIGIGSKEVDAYSQGNAAALEKYGLTLHPDEAQRLYNDSRADPNFKSQRRSEFVGSLPPAQVAIGGARETARTAIAGKDLVAGKPEMTLTDVVEGRTAPEGGALRQFAAQPDKNMFQSYGGFAEGAGEWAIAEGLVTEGIKLLPYLSRLEKSKMLWPIIKGGAVMTGIGALKSGAEPSQVSAGDTGAPTPDVLHVQGFKAMWNSMSPEQQQRYADSMTPEQFAAIAAQDKPGTPPHERNALLAATIRTLPSVGGNLGAWGGMVAGGGLGEKVGGPAGRKVGAVTGRAMGGSAGTAAGEYLRQRAEHTLGWDEGKYETGERVKDMEHAAEMGFVAESLAMLADKALTGSALPGTRISSKGKATTTVPGIGQTPERIANKLSYAGALEHGDPMEDSDVQQLLPKIIQKEKKKPVENTEDLANLYKAIREDNGKAVDRFMNLNAVGVQTPTKVKDVMMGPQKIIDELNELKKQYGTPALQQRYQKEIAAIDARIARWTDGVSLKPLSVDDMSKLRIQLNNNLRSYYSLARADKHAAAAFLMEHPELELDKVEAGAIRKYIYPEVDRIAGKAAGTMQKLQAERGVAISLEEQTKENITRARTQSEHAAGASPLKRGNLSGYVTSHGKFGVGAHRVTNAMSPPSPISDADKRAASAFGHTWPTRAGKAILAHPGPVRPLSLGTAIRDVPTYALTPSSREEDKDEPEATPESPATPSDLKSQAAQQSPYKAMTWTHYAKDKNGQIVVTNDPKGEQGWIYIDTGQPWKE